MSDEDLDKEIELAWEKWRGTREAEHLIELGFFTTISLAFCRYFIKNRRKDK